MTLESWSELFCRPLMEHSPRIWVFFIVFLTFTTFALLNIVTSIIVETTFSQVKRDDEDLKDKIEKEREMFVNALKAIFLHGDSDDSGMLSLDEFKAALEIPEVHIALAFSRVLNNVDCFFNFKIFDVESFTLNFQCLILEVVLSTLGF